jgi:hypothetical protein
MYNLRLLPAVVALSLTSSSCWQKSRAVFTPPPPQAQPTVPVQSGNLPTPPSIEGDPSAQLPPSIATSVPDVPEPPKPVPPPRRTVAAPKVTPAPPPQPDIVAPPRLGQIFTAEQRRDYNRTLNESLDRIRKALAIVAGKSLSVEQTEMADRIRTFEKQAEQAREQDLVTAVNLAKRADLLAQDLLQRLP